MSWALELLLSLLSCSGEPEASGACPKGMVEVPGGRFEAGATAVQVGAAETWPEPWNLPRARQSRQVEAFCIDRYEYPNDKGEEPMVWVGWDDAVALCEAQGKRLCTEDEWTLACAGPEGWLFPYGDEHQAGRCNDEVPVGEEGGIREAGDFPECASPYGAMDMQGNVSEWVADAHDWKEGSRVLRGGTMWTSIYGQGCMSRHAHQQHGPTHGDDGFRCCR